MARSYENSSLFLLVRWYILFNIYRHECHSLYYCHPREHRREGSGHQPAGGDGLPAQRLGACDDFGRDPRVGRAVGLFLEWVELALTLIPAIRLLI
jgi:hypothetical protein